MTAPDAGFSHAALLYDSPEGLVAAAVPFLADGLAAGDAVVLACRAEHNRLLAEALGDDRVLLVDPATVYARLPQAFAAMRRMQRRMAAAGRPRLRLLVEVPLGDPADGGGALARYEAACNVTLAPVPLSGVCAYDRRSLPAPVRHRVEQTHPSLLTAGGRSPSGRYTDPATVLRQSAVGWPDPVEATAPALGTGDLTDTSQLAAVRAQLRDLLGRPGRHWHLRSDFASAAAEVLANAFRHGRPPVTLRLWTTPARLVCTVTDHGPGFDATLAGYLPPQQTDDPTGAGLWLVRQSCDDLGTHRSRTGFTVRLATDLPSEDLPESIEPRAVHAEAAAVRADRARARAGALRRSSTERQDDVAARERRSAESAADLARLRDQLRRRRG